MAENVAITPGTGDVVGADDISGVKYQRVKLILGADGVNDGDVSSANPVPIDGTVDLGANNDVTLAVLPDTAATDLALQTADLDTIAGDTTSIDGKIPALGQALAAASVPVVLTADQITTLTPPAAISGFATAANQTTIIGHVDGVETLLGTVDADTSNISTKIDTIAGAVAGTEVQVDVLSSALPTGASTSAKQDTIITAVEKIDDLQTALTSIGTDSIDVNIIGGAGSGGTALTDDEAFTPATSSYTPVGGQTTADAVDAGDGGAFLMDTDRHQQIDIQDISKGTQTNDVKVTLDSESVAVTGTFWQATQPVSATNLDIRDLANTDVVTAELSAVDNAVLDAIAASAAAIDTDATTIIGHVDGIETLLGTIDADTSSLAGAVSGTEMQVDVLTMPTTTVQATNLDIRDLTATDVVTVHGDVGALDQIDLTNSNPAAVAIVDGNGDQITSFGGGTQYTEGDTDATITGTASLVEGAGDALAVLTQPLTDTQLRATPVPVSGTVTANLGTIADVATQTTLAAINAKLVTGTDIGDVTINNGAAAAAVNIQDGGNSITVDGSLTVDLGANNDVTLATLPDTAAGDLAAINASTNGVEGLLTTIDADTGAIKTAVELLDNAVDGNYLNVNMNLAGADAQAGEGIISATTQRITIATDDDSVAHLATIAGDTTAIQTATELLDDAVFVDDADWTADTSKNILVGAVTQVATTVNTDGDVTPLTTNAFRELRTAIPESDLATAGTAHVKKYYTNAGAVTDGIIWSPAAGKRWYVTDICIQVSAAATVTLEDDLAAGDSAIWKAELAANSGWSHSFNTPWFSGEDAADLIITTSAGNVYVTVTGYEI